MAALSDLQARIISETTRDDLADTLATDFANIIAKSIEQYAAERWWFNERRTLITCTPGQIHRLCAIAKVGIRLSREQP